MKQKRNIPFYRARCGVRRPPAPAREPEPEPANPIPYLAITYWNDRREGEDAPPDGCYVVFVA